jgi:hypothetical protein
MLPAARGQSARAPPSCRDENESEGSIGVVLLADIRDIFNALGVDRISSAHLIEKLCEITPRPWVEFGKSGKPITQNKLARLLKSFRQGDDNAITPQLIRLPDSDDPVRGYRRNQFDDAFARYLSPVEGDSNRYDATNADETGTSDLFQTVTSDPDVTVSKSQKSNNDGLCNNVTVGKGGNGGNDEWDVPDVGLSLGTFDALISTYDAMVYEIEPTDTTAMERLHGSFRKRLAGHGLAADQVEIALAYIIKRAYRPRANFNDIPF